MEVTSGYVADPNADRVFPGMTFENSYGTCTVIGPREYGSLWRVEMHDGHEHLMRPSTIMAAVDGFCKHPPSRLHAWTATDGTQCVGCNDCGAVLAGAS